MNNKSFLDELNQISKTKDEIEKERLEKEKILEENLKKEYVKGCHKQAENILSNIKDELKKNAQDGNFIYQNGKRRITFYVTVGNGYPPLFEKKREQKSTLFSNSHYYLTHFYWNEELINEVNNTLKELSSKEGIACEPIKIKYIKNIYKGSLASSKGKRLIDVQTRVYNIPNNRQYIEYISDNSLSDSDESCSLFVEGYIEY